MTDQTAYLNLVLEKLKERIAKLNLSLEEGAKEVEDMHEYYWENYTEMDQYGYEDYDNQQALVESAEYKSATDASETPVSENA